MTASIALQVARRNHSSLQAMPYRSENQIEAARTKARQLKIFPKFHLMDFLAKRKQMAELIFRTRYGFDLIASSCGEFKLTNLYHAQKIKFRMNFEYLGATHHDSKALRAAEIQKRPLLHAMPHAKPAQSIHHLTSKFLYPDTDYLPRVKFTHPLGRFAAILARKS